MVRRMLVSGREAVRILIATGAATGEAQARTVLSAGLAGSGLRTGSGRLYDGAAVERVGQRPWLGADLTGFESGGRQFRLAPPGDWFTRWERHRVPSGRGGRPWVIRMPRAA
jgi:hypothetical protein